jgi:hypothetical protein
MITRLVQEVTQITASDLVLNIWPELRGFHWTASLLSVLPPGLMSRSTYVDDSNYLIIVSHLPFVQRNVQVSRRLLVSVRQGMIPQCQRGENTRDVKPPPTVRSHSRTSDNRLVVQ